MQQRRVNRLIEDMWGFPAEAGRVISKTELRISAGTRIFEVEKKLYRGDTVYLVVYEASSTSKDRRRQVVAFRAPTMAREDKVDEKGRIKREIRRVDLSPFAPGARVQFRRGFTSPDGLKIQPATLGTVSSTSETDEIQLVVVSILVGESRRLEPVPPTFVRVIA